MTKCHCFPLILTNYDVRHLTGFVVVGHIIDIDKAINRTVRMLDQYITDIDIAINRTVRMFDQYITDIDIAINRTVRLFDQYITDIDHSNQQNC